MQKKLLLGNEAVARGLWEAGCTFISSYPGTPSTEIPEAAAGYPEIYCEWATNEKVALEAAIGASVAGARACTTMKHVGLNVAADPLFTAAYTGVGAGLLIIVADDPGCHSSQNEQDSRHFARAAKLPMYEPSDAEECRSYILRAFEISERFDTPVLVRLSTRVSHSRTLCQVDNSRLAVELRPYVKNPRKYVMVPANARPAHENLEKRVVALQEGSETTAYNTVLWGENSRVGIISGGITYQTAREAMGDAVSYIKLGLAYPLPVEPFLEFAATVDKVIVAEELDDFIESHCRAIGLDVIGKDAFSRLGEYTPDMIRRAVARAEAELNEVDPPARKPLPELAAVPPRPPLLCAGCPHRGVFHVLRQKKCTVLGDIGCYTLGGSPPLSSIDVCVCMGASISSLHGFLKVRPDKAKQSVAVIGDSTFMHSGMTGLLNMVYNQTPGTVIILDNNITGMTGHQQNPGTGLTLQQQPAPILDLPALCSALGVKRVRSVDPLNVAAFEHALTEELDTNEVSVIVAKRPCALLPNVQPGKKVRINPDACKQCGACTRLGCPAIDQGFSIDNQCRGCGLCAQVCKFGAIEEV